jgi:hypothetical protein
VTDVLTFCLDESIILPIIILRIVLVQIGACLGEKIVNGKLGQAGLQFVDLQSGNMVCYIL